MEDQNNTTESPAPAPAPAPQAEAKAEEAWECPVCYGDGGRTGQLRIACGHQICLECYMKIRETRQGEYGRPEARCPLCRTLIRTSAEPTETERRDLERQANNVRLSAERVQHLQRQLTTETAHLAVAHARLRREAEGLGLWPELEARATPGWTEARHAPAIPAEARAHGITERDLPRPHPPLIPAEHQPIADRMREARAEEVRQEVAQHVADQQALARQHGDTIARRPAPAHGENHRRCPGCRRERDGVYYRRINKRDGTQTRLLRCQTCAEEIARE
jgi:DNA-directed RNA polymerase subunit M/transcription elongation factor TFIIS